MASDIDLVICEHGLPGGGGVQLARDLRGGKWNDVPLLLLSSNPHTVQDADVEELKLDILQKPTPRDELFEKLSEIAAALPGAQPAETEEELGAPPGELTLEEAYAADNAKVVSPDGEGAVLDQSEDLASAPRQMRVLAAEDNKTNQLVFRKMVKHLNIDLRFANNGGEAVAAYQDFEPDLIFMDISMPVMDGKQATMEIRKIEEETGRHVPIVALTAHAMAGDSEGILAAGLDHYLTKPLRKALILERIGEYAPQDAQPIDISPAA
jgi:CheY-like chemotaxis protein